MTSAHTSVMRVHTSVIQMQYKLNYELFVDVLYLAP